MGQVVSGWTVSRLIGVGLIGVGLIGIGLIVAGLKWFWWNQLNHDVLTMYSLGDSQPRLACHFC